MHSESTGTFPITVVIVRTALFSIGVDFDIPRFFFLTSELSSVPEERLFDIVETLSGNFATRKSENIEWLKKISTDLI